MQKGNQNNLYQICKDVIPKAVLNRKNKARTWQYGYNPKYDIVIISKSGQIGEIYNINEIYDQFFIYVIYLNLCLNLKNIFSK